MACCLPYAANGETLTAATAAAAADPAAEEGLSVRCRLPLLDDGRPLPPTGDEPEAYRPPPLLLFSLSDDGDGDVPPLLLAGRVAADEGGGLLATAGLPQLLSVVCTADAVAVAVSMVDSLLSATSVPLLKV